MTEERLLVLNHENKSQMIKIFKALQNPSALKVYELLNDGYLRSLSEISKILGLTLAAISAIIKGLEEAKLVGVKYEPGRHGVRKICWGLYDRFSVIIDA